MSKSNQRICEMEAIIMERSAIPLKELSKLLGVSEMTVRRDLSVLQERCNIINIRGLLIYYDAFPGEQYNIENAIDSHREEKRRIGEAAAAMIEENDVVMLDIGSTTEYVARALRANLSATVICVTYNVLSHLAYRNNLKIFFTGGQFHPDTQLMECDESLEFLGRTRAMKLFASAAGIHPQLGITCANSYEMSVKKALIASSAECILLADSSKFGRVEGFCFADLSNYHKVITDKNLDPKWEKYLLEKNIELIKV